MFTSRGHYYRWQKKALVTDHLRLSAHQLLSASERDDRYLGTWQWLRDGAKVASLMYMVLPAERAVRLIYDYQKQPVEPYLVHFTTSTPPYGGQRYWWLCPVCGRRCADLFSGRTFACRKCYDLTYESAQSGDPRNTRVERRLRAIRHRLGADSGLLNPLPEAKPKHMRWATYTALLREYDDLQAIWLGDLGLAVGLGAERPELVEATELLWTAYQRGPEREPPDLAAALALIDATLAACTTTVRPRRQPRRRTLGQTAKAAEIPLAFAREAQVEGLLRPDGGRGTRRPRYRTKVASWLAKLHTLRQAGYTWDAIHDWTSRRFTPGHEHERRWPADFTPPPSSS